MPKPESETTDLEKVMLALPVELRETLSILLLEKFTDGYEQATKIALSKFEEAFRANRTN